MFVLTCTSGIVLSKGVRLFTPPNLIPYLKSYPKPYSNGYPNAYPNHNPNPQLYPLKLFLYSLELGGGVKSRSLISKGDFLHPLFNTGNQGVKGRETLSNYIFLPPTFYPP